MAHNITVAIASSNRAKIDACRKAFKSVFTGIHDEEFISYSAESGVAPTPRNYAQTKIGAEHRLEALKKKYPKADYHVSIEGGFDQRHTSACYDQICIMLVAKGDKTVPVESMRYTLPKDLSDRIKENQEASDALAALTGIADARQKSGTLGFVTGGILQRTDLIIQPLIVAFSQIKHAEDYVL